MNEEKEIWKDIAGYEGLYQVSNIGRVKSLPRCKPTDKRKTHNNIRKPKLSKNGYYRINLSKKNCVKFYSIHRLVAIAFLPNPNNLPCVNHKDENSANNFVYVNEDGSIDYDKSNLEWCTIQYNCNYGTARIRQQISRKNNPNDKYVRKLVGIKNSRAVKQLTPEGKLIAIHRSITEASRVTGVHMSQISRHCNGRVGNDMNRPIRKFKFEYA